VRNNALTGLRHNTMCNFCLQRLMKNEITPTALMSRFLLPPCADNLTSWKVEDTSLFPACIISVTTWSHIANRTSVMYRRFTDKSFQLFQLQKNLNPVTNYSPVHNPMCLTLSACVQSIPIQISVFYLCV